MNRLPKAQILSTGRAIPSSIVSTDDLLKAANTEKYGIPSDIISRELGIQQVRHAEGVTISQLAAEAGRKALDKSSFQDSHADIDAVIYCGCEREKIEPSTAHLVSNHLDLNAEICFDISNACHGFTAGIVIAKALVESGQCRNVLLVTAEICSPHVQQFIQLFNSGKDMGPAQNLLGAFSLGDAGGAMLIGPNQNNDERGLSSFLNRSNSRYHKLCHYNNPTEAGMDMGKIVAQTLRMGRKLMPETYQQLTWTPEDVDACIPHQVGKRAYDKTIEMAGLNGKESLKTYETLGNLASATIPVNYDLMSEKGMIKPFSKVLLLSSGSGISITQAGLIA